MAGRKNVHHHSTKGDSPTTLVGDTDRSIQSAEDDLRRLDEELDRRINQVLKLTQPPRHIPRVNKIAKPPPPRLSQKTNIPPATYKTCGIISILNGKVEVQGQTIKNREEMGISKAEVGVHEALGSDKEVEGSVKEVGTFKVKESGITHLTGGKGLNVDKDSAWGIGLPSVLPTVGAETPNYVIAGKQDHISEAQGESNADGQKRYEERNAAENYTEKVQNAGSAQPKGMNSGISNEAEYNDKEKGENATDESDEDIDDQDAIFDEFLDTHTRGKIQLLMTKVTMLTQALQAAKDECMSLSNQKRELSRALQEGEGERRVLARRVTALQQDSTRLTRTNTQLSTQVKELTTECQALRKEMSCVRQREGEQRGTHNTLQAQLSRARAESASLRNQLSALTTRHKEEVKGLRKQVEEAEKKGWELERARRNLAALTAKQERLIEVLQKQKRNIAAGKAVAALEEKFLATIAPLQPQ